MTMWEGEREGRSGLAAQRRAAPGRLQSRGQPLFRPGRHRLTAAAYRATMQERGATWREVAGLRAA